MVNKTIPPRKQANTTAPQRPQTSARPSSPPRPQSPQRPQGSVRPATPQRPAATRQMPQPEPNFPAEDEFSDEVIAEEQGPEMPGAEPVSPPASNRPVRAPAARATQTPARIRPSALAEVPDYIKGNTIRGSENVEMEDLIIPRIELVQALSKCLIEGSAEYIEGARPGMFFNSVTRELYPPTLTICPVYFKKQHLCWRDRDLGGGFGGAFDSIADAKDRIAQEENPDEWEVNETAQHIVLVVDFETGETFEAVISMARTKLKVSRQFNSLIRVNGFDRFSRIYELFSVNEQNSRNQDYKNIGLRYIDYAPVAVYKAAEELYNSIASGIREVKIDDNYDDAIDTEAMPPQGGDEQSEY